MTGCEGEKGITGSKGLKGRNGDPGTDPGSVLPANRHFALGVTNNSRNAVDGKKMLYLTFDSTVVATRDTIVATRISQPPLIDGVDGDEYEWGLNRSKPKLAFLNTDFGVVDPKIPEMTIRVAYDRDYIYMFLQWKEVKITIRDTSGKDVAAYLPLESNETDELYFSRNDKVTHPDKANFKWIRERKDTVVVLIQSVDSLGNPIVVTRNRVVTDTTYIWLPVGRADDRLAVFWGDDATSGWQDIAFREYFGLAGSGGTLPSDLFVDVWAWGAGLTRPVACADDWVLTGSGLRPDVGNAPYFSNWIYPDSIPRFQNRRDPNVRTAASLTAVTYPLWYYDIVGYSRKGWGGESQSACYLPGIITTIPSGSRADVYAMGKFDSGGGLWTLELRRARRTSSGDDLQF
jgi:hypothetical protein